MVSAIKNIAKLQNTIFSSRELNFEWNQGNFLQYPNAKQKEFIIYLNLTKFCHNKNRKLRSFTKDEYIYIHIQIYYPINRCFVEGILTDNHNMSTNFKISEPNLSVDHSTYWTLQIRKDLHKIAIIVKMKIVML